MDRATRAQPRKAAAALPAIPFDDARPRTARDVLEDVRYGADFIAHNLPRAHRVLVRLRPYPAPWRLVTLTAHDGAKLTAWHGPGRPGAPAVLMVPGTFQTKDDAPRRRRALDLWRRLGAHVLIVDLRGFGGSHATLGTAGLLEARDVLDAADWLRGQSGAARVIAWGESLGGAVALCAGARDGAAERIARIVAWSPFADLSDAILASSPTSRRGRTLVGRTYRFLLRQRTRSAASDFGAYLRLRARELDVDLPSLLVAGSPCFHVEDLEVPAFVFHAADDPIVPVNHARLLERVARERAPRLSVQIQPRGGHLDFDRVAPAWYAQTSRAIVEAP